MTGLFGTASKDNKYSLVENNCFRGKDGQIERGVGEAIDVK